MTDIKTTIKSNINTKPSDLTLCDYAVSGDGEALFLIHGIGAAKDTWRFAIPVLEKHFKVISYDLRGHGKSFKPPLPITLDDLVDDLENLRQHLNIPKAHFAGHSLGGMIAPAYARKHPDRVLSLGLLSTAAGRSAEATATLDQLIGKMRDEGVENVLPSLVDRWYTDDFVTHHNAIVQRRLQQVVDTDSDEFLSVFHLYAHTEMLPWLHEIKAPCLVMTGENDAGCNPTLNQMIADTLDNAHLHILPNLKHSILLEAGELVANIMVQYIVQITENN